MSMSTAERLRKERRKQREVARRRMRLLVARRGNRRGKSSL